MRKYNIASDLVLVRAIQPVVYKQYDNGDTLEVELYEDGGKIALTNETVLAFFQLEDNTVIQKTCSISNGNAIATLDNNILSQSGKLLAEFTIYKNGKETTTRAILISVESSINRNESIETVPQWDIVQQLLAVDTNDLKNMNNEVNNLKLIYKSPVANFAAISTTYTTPSVGWTVQTTDDGKFYRYDGTAWQYIQVMNNTILTDIQNRLSDANRQSTTLAHGTQVINATTNSPVDVEIQGRTLISLGNSNLEVNKNYVLADKRTKIRAEGREGTLINGVSKFTKSASLITKADFVGKVSGSVTEVAHIAKATGNSVLQTPTGSWAENTQQRYDQITTLNGTISNYGFTSVSGAFAQQLFSFNIIEQIERKLGRIPADILSGKIQWIKDNVQRLTANWHGWGSSVGGNGASFRPYASGIWNSGYIFTTTSGSVAKLTVAVGVGDLSVLQGMIQTDSFVHFLAYTSNPSDGTTPSQLNTDFIELEIELKTTAVLDTRPIVTRVATFEGKVSGSTVENPHVAKVINNATLQTPSNFTVELTGGYSSISTLNGVSQTTTNTTNGQYAQHLFSFNLIEEIERNLGRIPKATLADKVQWVKDNVQSFTCEWSGFGSSVGGSKASLRVWNVTNNQYTWNGVKTHTNPTVTKLTFDLSVNVGELVDANSLISFIAFAEPSDGVTASTINTDYISLDITLKQGATLFDPVLPLYEVDATDYANILTTWDEAAVLNRYPKVQGVQHLQNLAVIAEGENLLPPFSEWELHANATVKSAYELELNATGNYQKSYGTVSVLPNQVYTFTRPNGVGRYDLFYQDVNRANISSLTMFNDGGGLNYTFTTPSNCRFVRVAPDNNATLGKFTFTNPMLTPGSTPKPFVPRNPSYLFAPVKLGQVGSVKDSLLPQDGQWMMRKVVEKDVVLDGSLAWVNLSDKTGHKLVHLPSNPFPNSNVNSHIITKFNGMRILKDTVGVGNVSDLYDGANSGYLWLTVSDLDTGFGESYVPTNDDWKRYFNGWKYTDGTTWTSVTGNGQTANGATALSTKPTDYTPYKLSYVLATPQLVNVTDKVEGALAVSGPTQVEVTSGVVVREKVVPSQHSTNLNWYINEQGLAVAIVDNPLKHRTLKILNVYKNGQQFSRFVRNGIGGNGEYGYISNVDYETAEYTVTYLVLDRHLQTVNATEVKSSYAGSLKDSVDMSVEKLTDLTTQTSINTNLIYRLLVQAKANNWSV
jgi:hypothetical protein